MQKQGLHCWLSAVTFGILIAIAPAVHASQGTSGCDPVSLLTNSRPAELKNVVVVAGYSTGADIAPQLKALGIQNVIHVHPTPEVPKTFQKLYRESRANYIEEYAFSGDVKGLTERLTFGGRKIDAIFAGSETGVPLVNMLNRELGLKGNDPAMSDYHRVKSLMQERIDQMGLSSIRGLKTGDVEAALAWIQTKNQGIYPVVVKPLDGAGSQGFNLCFNEADVRAAFTLLLGKRTALDTAMNEVLVQRYINAEEYVVNTISRDGKHLVTEIWHYNKIKIQRPDGGHSKIYNYDELLALDSPVAAELVPYALKVLDALAVTNGPGHMELMLPAEGPVLMEIGTRLMGGRTHNATRDAMGTSSLDLMIDGALFPERFEATAKAGVRVRKSVRHIQLISTKAGTITKVNFNKEQLAKLLPSFAGMGSLGVGDKLVQTIDLFSSPGSLWLISESPAQVERDFQKFRNEIEPQLFDVLSD